MIFFFFALYSTQVASSSDNTEGAILKQTVLKGIANQLTQATVSHEYVASDTCPSQWTGSTLSDFQSQYFLCFSANK